MPIDITKEATGEGQARYSVPVVGASNDLALGRIAGGSVADVANANVISGISVMHRVDIPDATGDTDVVLTHKTRVLNAWIVKTGGAGAAGNTLTFKNGSNAITNALNTNVADTTLVGVGVINDAQHEIEAGGTLRVSNNKAGGNAACTAYVHCLRVA